jgi:hypothetical protein
MDEIFKELFVIVGCFESNESCKPETVEMFNEFVVIVVCFESNIGCNPDT